MRHLQRGIKLGAISALAVLGAVTPTAFADTSVTTTTTSVSGQASNTLKPPQVKLSQDDALNIAKGLFPDIFSALGSPNINLQPFYGPDTGQVYGINWPPMGGQNQAGPRIKASAYTFIMIDANTGQLLQFQHDQSQWVNQSGKTIAEDKAAAIAKTWLQKLAPSQVSELALQPNSSQANSGFVYQFMREVNGIVAPFDSATIQLDQSGNLTEYSFSWHDVTFPTVPDKLLSSSDAAAKYKQNLNMQLQYQTAFSFNNRGPSQLVYQPQSLDPTLPVPSGSTPILDANSGQAIGQDGKPLTNASPQGLSPLVAGGPTAFPKAQNAPMSESTLEDQVAAQLNLSADDWKLSNAQKMTETGGPVSTHALLSLNYSNSKTNDNINVEVDMQDGVILNYNRNPVPLGNNSQSPGSIQDPQIVADEFVKKLFPNLTGAIARTPQPVYNGPDTQQSFSYDFLVNGVATQGIMVNVDTSSGLVQYFGLRQDPSADFPSTKNVISVDAAKTAYVKKDPVELQYMLPETLNPSAGAPFPFQYGNQAQLVYAATPLLNGPGSLNALTGDWIDFPSGLPQTAGVPKGATSAEKAIAILEGNNVIVGDEGKADLSKPITHAEFIAWLSRADNFNIGGGPAPQFSDVDTSNPYASEISQALMQGWLPNTGKLNPSAPLTRDEAARWFVDWLNWQGAAAHTEFFKIPYSDVSAVPASDRGAAVMMSDTGILPLEKGKFNPNQQMTIGDAAIALVNAVGVVLNSK